MMMMMMIIYKERSLKDFKIQTHNNVEFENNNDTSNNRDNWNYLKIIQKIRTNNTPRKHDVKELQKTTTLGTEHTLRKVLISK